MGVFVFISKYRKARRKTGAGAATGSAGGLVLRVESTVYSKFVPAVVSTCFGGLHTFLSTNPYAALGGKLRGNGGAAPVWSRYNITLHGHGKMTGAAIPAMALAVGRRYLPGPPRDSLNRGSNILYLRTWTGLDSMKIEKNASVAAINDTCIQEWFGQGPMHLGGPDQTKPDQGR